MNTLGYIVCVLMLLMICLLQATPRLSEDKVKQCVDPKLNNDYPPKAVAKVRLMTTRGGKIGGLGNGSNMFMSKWDTFVTS